MTYSTTLTPPMRADPRTLSMGADRTLGMVGADVPASRVPDASARASPVSSLWGGAPGTSRPTMGADRRLGMVGADVPGGPRARCVRAGVPGVVPLARRAGDVAPYHGCGQDVGHGRGRRPRRPACPWMFPCARRCSFTFLFRFPLCRGLSRPSLEKLRCTFAQMLRCRGQSRPR